MQVQQFRLYDIVVDLLPGVLLIIVLYPAHNSSVFNNLPKIISSGPVLAISLLAMGYILGRLVHSFAGKINKMFNTRETVFSWVFILEVSTFLLLIQAILILIPISQEDLWSIITLNFSKIQTTTTVGFVPGVLYLLSMAFLCYIMYQVGQSLWKEDLLGTPHEGRPLTKLLPIEYPDDEFDDWLREQNNPISPSHSSLGVIENTMIEELRKEFSEQYDIDPMQTSLMNARNDVEWVRYIGYSHLFNKQNLYHRYNILTTFFRNISVIFWFGFLFYSIINLLFLFGIYAGGLKWTNWVLETRYTITWFLLLLAVATSTQVNKYSKYRNRQFIAELYESLKSR